MRPIFLTLLIIACCTRLAMAQDCGMVTYDSDDGLAATNYISIFQDSRGILWVGSYGHGVSRFDGHRWENWTQPYKIFNNTVVDIFEDGEGGIWFDHNESGCSRLKDGKMQNFDLHARDNAIGNLVYDPKQQKVFIVENGWVAQPSTRIFEFDYTSRKFLPTGKQVFPEALVRKYKHFAISKGMRADDWVAFGVSEKGIPDYYAFEGATVKPLPRAPDAFDAFVRIIYPGDIAGENMVLQNSKAVFVLHDGKWRQVSPPEIPRYTKGKAFPGMHCGGCSYDRSGKRIFIIWVPNDKTFEKRYLLSEYSLDMQLRQTLLFSNPYLEVISGRQIRKDAAGTIWVATSGNVLRLFPDQLFIPATVPGMPSQAWGVAQAGDGNIWFSSVGESLAGFDGLYMLPPPRELSLMTTFNDGSLTDKSGNVYFNSATKPHVGILKFDGRNTWSDLIDTDVLGAFLGRNNDGQIIWGTLGAGLWIQDRTDDSGWRKIDRTKGLLLENVLSALQDRDGC